MAFAKAAFAAGRPVRLPITVASSSPPSSSIVLLPSVATSSAVAASPQPSVSSRCSFAAARTSVGTSSRARLVVHSANLHVAVMSDRPVVVGTWERLRRLGGVALVEHERAPELDHDLAALVHAAAAHRDDADAGVRAGLPLVGDLALGPERIAREDRVRELDVGPGEVGRGVLTRVRDGHAGHEREGERRVHQWAAEPRPLREGDVEMDLVRVHRQAREPDVVRLRDRAPEATPEDVADVDVLVEPAAPGLRRGSVLTSPCQKGVSVPFTRTATTLRVAAPARISATSFRATGFSSGGTASSRSATTTSAPESSALSSLRPSLPGAKSTERAEASVDTGKLTFLRKSDIKMNPSSAARRALS